VKKAVRDRERPQRKGLESSRGDIRRVLERKATISPKRKRSIENSLERRNRREEKLKKFCYCS